MTGVDTPHLDQPSAPVPLADVLSSPVRRLLVDYLAADPQQAATDGPRSSARTAKEIAEHLGVHVTTARFHLDQLVSAGIVDTRSVRSGVGRPHKVYAIRPGSLRTASTDQSYRHLTELLADTLAAEDHPTPEQAGQSWARAKTAEQVGPIIPPPARTSGQWLGKVGQIIDALYEWGYTPEIALAADGRTARVTLRACPFIELAHKHPDIVCGVHRGLIRGALEALGEDDAEIGLEPFIGPTTCLAHIRTRSPFDHETPSTLDPA